jgi:isoleucyl-tRNA synthetase
VSAIDRVREVCSSALALRTTNKLRVRLPLASLRVAAPDAERLSEFADMIRDEVNVKEVSFTTDVAAHGKVEITVNSRVAGPRLGKEVQSVIKAVKSGDWTITPQGVVVAGGVELKEGEFERRLVSKDAGAAAELPGGSGIVVLDTNVTPELALEGVARDLVRVIQQARRDAGLSVSDRIMLTIDAPADVTAAARVHEPLIRSETLAVDLAYQSVADGAGGKVGDGVDVRLGIVRVAPNPV